MVTEGVLTRRLQHDRDLAGVGVVIFDELHERNLQTDLGLALTLDAAEHRQLDLRVLAMSATIAAERVAALLGGRARRHGRDRGPPGRPPLGTTAPEGPPRTSSRRRRPARPARRRRRRPRVPPRRGRDPPHGRPPGGRRRDGNASRSTSSTGCSAPPTRTPPSRRRGPAGARSCWRPTSPRAA